jgi:hypothetical protein
VDPLEIVNLVIPAPDEKYWPDFKDASKFPYTIQVPAISAAWMMNKTTNDKIQMGVDIALIALSAGEYAAAKGALQYVWITAKIAFPLANEVIKNNPSIVYKLYGAYENVSDEEKKKRRDKADTFIEWYGVWTNLVNLGAMGEGVYTVYKNVRGSAAEMKALGVTDETGAMNQLEQGINKFDDALPDHLKLGKLRSMIAGEAEMLEKLKGYGKILDDFKVMDDAAKTKFIDDFANASEDVLKALDSKEAELLESWKNFRKKYPTENLQCN